MHVNTCRLLRRDRGRAFTLAEVLISMAIIGLTMGGILFGYLAATRQAEFAAYSLAAQSLALQRLEQTRAASWQPNNSPVVDELQATNFPPVIEIMDIPITGPIVSYATNFTSISNMPTASALRMVRVDCVWSFPKKGTQTNTIVTYRAPDQ